MLKKIRIKIISFIILTVLMAIIQPLQLKAVNEKMSVVNTKDDEYIIYIKDYTDKKFKYAFTNNENPGKMDLIYINSISDLNGNQAALMDVHTYDKIKGQPIYIWVKDEEENVILDGVEVDFENVLTTKDIKEIENITKRISVEISESKDNTDSTIPVREEEIEGVKETAKAGYIKITDSKNAKYYYQSVKITDSEEYAKLMELAENLNNKYDEMNIYEKVQEDEEFYRIYSKLINKANWEKVNNMEIKEPESTEQNNGVGDKYIVFLKKVAKDGDTTVDAQFLQEYYDYQPNLVKEQIQTKETSKLPITYDSIALIVILAIVVIAMIIVFIRMKKLNKKDANK